MDYGFIYCFSAFNNLSLSTKKNLSSMICHPVSHNNIFNPSHLFQNKFIFK